MAYYQGLFSLRECNHLKTTFVGEIFQACFGEADGSTGAVSTCQGLLSIARWPSDSTEFTVFPVFYTESYLDMSFPLWLLVDGDDWTCFAFTSAKECSRALFYIWTEAHCGPAPQSRITMVSMSTNLDQLGCYSFQPLILCSPSILPKNSSFGCFFGTCD